MPPPDDTPTQATDNPAGEEATQGEHLSQRQLNILHVEDDDIDAKIVALCLAQYRGRTINLIRAISARQARQLVKEHDIDLVILDFWLGTESSLGLLSELGGRGGLLPAIVMSGLSTPQTRQIVLKNGALAFLGKDRLTAGALEDVIESALQAFQNEATHNPLPGPTPDVSFRAFQIESRFNDILGFLDKMHEHSLLATMLPEQRASHLRALEALADDARAAIFSGFADLRQPAIAAESANGFDLRLLLDDLPTLVSGILAVRRQRLVCTRPDMALHTSLDIATTMPLVTELVAITSRLTADGAEIAIAPQFSQGHLALTMTGAQARPGEHPALTVRLPSLTSRLQREGLSLTEDLMNEAGPTLTLFLPATRRGK